MSGTLPAASDRTASYGAVIVSCVTLAIFLTALGIAWWTKDSSLPILLGVAATNASTAVSYWLGSSSGSKTKDSVIAQQATPPPGTTTTTVTPLTTTMGTTR
jgi:hypothetical protein